ALRLQDGRRDEPQADRRAHGCTLRSDDRSPARTHVGRRRGTLAEELGRRRSALARGDDAARLAQTSSSSIAGASGVIAAVSRACNSVVRTISFARAKLSIT